MTHPTFETLLDFVEHRLPEATHRQVSVHLASPCPVCQAEVEAIRDMLHRLKQGYLAEPPSDVVRRAIRLFTRLHEQLASDSRPRLIAHRIFDSQLIPAAMATRGVGQERQMLFGAEGLDIDLQVTGEAGQRTIRLIGQVMPTDDDPSRVQGCLVRLAREGEVTATAMADELGTFAFQAVVPDDYELWLDLPDAEVWIPGLTIGPIGTP